MSRGHVIFAEDNDDFRTLLSEGLRFLDFRVSEVVDGDAAMRVLTEADPPFVVLTDLHMPMSSGYDLLAALKHDGLETLIRVVVLTANPDPQIANAVLLSKPVALEKLAQTLDAQLEIAADYVEAVRTRLHRLRQRKG